MLVNGMRLRALGSVLALVLLAGLLAGCATSKIDWNGRVGNYTYDQAVIDYGPPDRTATLSDGSSVCEWLLMEGNDYTTVDTFNSRWYTRYEHVKGPDDLLRLTFGPDGKLRFWKRVMK